MPISVRCNKCKQPSGGKHSGHKHASRTGHVWSPGYECTDCRATFMKRSQCEKHAATCGHVATTKATRHPLYSTAAYWSRAEFQARVRDVTPGSDFTPVSTPSPSLDLSPSGPPISQLIACSKCNELFPHAYALHMHRQLGHSDLVTHAGGGTDLHAEPTSDDVRDELGQRHLDIQLEETACSAATFNTETVQETCYICGIAFSDEVALDTHLASTFSCTVCAVHHASVEALQEHYQRELKLHPQCRACGLAFDGIPAWARGTVSTYYTSGGRCVCAKLRRHCSSGSHTIPQTVNAETYSYHDYTTDGRPQLIPPLGDDELSSSQGGSDRGQVNSELVSTLTVSASVSVPHRGWDERVIAAGIHRPYSVLGSAIPNISPNPVRCNQCKLVCKNVGELQWHAKQTGHTHKPMYFCPVCLVTLHRLKDKRSHIRTTGHYTASPAFRHSLSADLSSATPATSFASPGPNTTRRIDLTRHSHCPPQLQHHFLESLLTAPTSFHSPASMSIPKDRCSAPKSFLGPAEHFLRASAHAAVAPPPNFPGPSIRKQIVPSTAESTVSERDMELSTRAMQDKDWPTAEVGSGMSALPFADSDWSEVFPGPSTEPTTMAPPRCPTSSITDSSTTQSSYHTTLSQPLFDEQTNGVLQDEAVQPTARSSTTSATGQSEPAQSPTACLFPKSQATCTTQAYGSSTKDPTGMLSYHCRVCLNDPCVEPVVTICGHIFCRSCLLQEMMSRSGCPVCGKMFFTMLDVRL